MSSEFCTDDYLPDWTIARFAVLDASEKWASAVHREVLDRLPTRSDRPAVTTNLAFESSQSARETMLVCELNNTVGLIMFAAGVERDCLSLLGGLARHRIYLPTLIVAEDVHQDLLPVLYEAGAQTVLFDVKDDIPIAKWCVRVLQGSLSRP